MNRHIVIDITQLIHWQGKLTGIPRVMNELAIRYKNEKNVEFIAWDPAATKYLKLDTEKSIQDRGKKIHYAESRSGEVAPVFFIFRVLRKLKHLGIPVPGKLISITGRASNTLRSYEFNKGDLLFVLWGELNDQKFISKLQELNEQGIDLIQASYDLLPLVTPQYSGHSTNGMATYNKAIFPIAKLILAISQHTKLDIEQWLTQQGVSAPLIKVFRLGDDFKLSAAKKPSDTAFIQSGVKTKDYLLMVGTIEARKNHSLIYYVYKLAAQKGIELPKIVIVGRQGWLAEGVYELMTKDPVVKDKFVILEGVSDEELSWLYKNALFSVYPSFYEGWGLPIAESIAHGTPCICSNTSSMPEVAGDLVDYFDPCSTDECLQKIQEFLNPVNLAKKRAKIQKYQPTSWDTAFEQVKEYIEEIYVTTN